MEPLHKPHLSNADPEQNTSAEGIERTNGDDRRRVISVEAGENTDADCHADRSGDCESTAEYRFPHETTWDHRNPGAQSETFEDLVEENDDEQSDEAGVGGNDKGQTDHCGMTLAMLEQHLAVVRLTN